MEQNVDKLQEDNDGENQKTQESRKPKRWMFLLIILLLAGGVFFIYKFILRDPLLPYVKAERNISASDFDGFIKHLDEKRKMNLLKVLSINSKGNLEADCLDIKKEIIWRASHWMSYPLKKNDVEYHEIVKWTARKIRSTCPIG